MHGAAPEHVSAIRERLHFPGGTEGGLRGRGRRMRRRRRRGGEGRGRVEVGHTRNRIIDSSPTRCASLLPSFPRRCRWRAEDEANQGIMEELHTCSASCIPRSRESD
ncbi:hypothetical protein PUN28_003418 [Cardiocondyla obscurior]|uniref:Uncharacterized protein n=1 Tax=Cardiocondyla obscurior TaxID=286306 RepID=A0AAW2GNK7_9HYME